MRETLFLFSKSVHELTPQFYTLFQGAFCDRIINRGIGPPCLPNFDLSDFYLYSMLKCIAVILEDHFTAFRIQCSQFYCQNFDVHVHVS
jgi:hypothetical protein